MNVESVVGSERSKAFTELLGFYDGATISLDKRDG